MPTVRRARPAQAAYYLAPIAWGLFFIAIIGALSAYGFELGASVQNRCVLLGAYWAAWGFSIFHVAMAAFSALGAVLGTRENNGAPGYVRLTKLLLSWIGTPNTYRRNQGLLYWLICGLVSAAIGLLVYWHCT